MDVPSRGLASALRQRHTPLWSRRPPLWRTCLLPSSIASTSRRAVFAPTTVSTLVIPLELPAPIVVPSVFLKLPLTAPTTDADAATTAMISSPIISSRRVPLSIPVAMALPITMHAVLVPGPSFAVVAMSSFSGKKTRSREQSAVLGFSRCSGAQRERREQTLRPNLRH